jgi:ubiquinone/menaquinone biosynthesis C-methylase UbiE
MSVRGRLFAAIYDSVLRNVEAAGLSDKRAALLKAAVGDVLEVGGGTGANLKFYGDDVTSLTITEPEEPMIKRLDRNARAVRPMTKVMQAPAEDLPFNDDSFDTVVCTLVLCTAGDPDKAISELRRVLRPGGKLLFIEHVESEDPKVARLQRRMHRINKFVAYGCHTNRRTIDALQAEDFDIVDLTHGELTKAPPFLRPLVYGVAAPREVVTRAVDSVTST